MNNPLLELYSDYLISSFALITATGLSPRLDNAFSHDQITRFLSGSDYTSRDLWALVKPTVRAIEADDGVLIFDDTIQEKPHSDENAIIAWHFDHCANRTVKGVNLLNGLYQAGGVNVPVAFESVHKDVPYGEVETRKLKRQSATTQNERLRQRRRVCQKIALRYRYVLTDNGFSSKENRVFITVNMGKEFVMALNSNRTVALTPEDQRQGVSSGWTRCRWRKAPLCKATSKGFRSRWYWPSQSLPTKTAAPVSSIWPQAISCSTTAASRPSTKNGGASRSSTKPSSPTPAWPARRPTPSGRKATTFSHPSMRSSYSNYSSRSTR